jgi:hypothetical protein
MYGIPRHVPRMREPHPRELSIATGAYPRIDAIENALDFELAATFPASDALSITQPGGGSGRLHMESRQ